MIKIVLSNIVISSNKFGWGFKLPMIMINYDSNNCTIVEGIAGLELDKDKWKLDMDTICGQLLCYQ